MQLSLTKIITLFFLLLYQNNALAIEDNPDSIKKYNILSQEFFKVYNELNSLLNQFVSSIDNEQASEFNQVQTAWRRFERNQCDVYNFMENNEILRTEIKNKSLECSIYQIKMRIFEIDKFILGHKEEEIRYISIILDKFIEFDSEYVYTIINKTTTNFYWRDYTTMHCRYLLVFHNNDINKINSANEKSNTFNTNKDEEKMARAKAKQELNKLEYLRNKLPICLLRLSLTIDRWENIY